MVSVYRVYVTFKKYAVSQKSSHFWLAITLMDMDQLDDTVKLFNVVDLKVGNFTCKIILTPFTLANSLISKKMFYKACLLAVVDFEKSHATWALWY